IPSSCSFGVLLWAVFLGRFSQHVKRVDPRIKAAHGLVLAPVAGAVVAFAIRSGGNFAGENAFAVFAQIVLNFFEQRGKGFGGHGFAALVEIAIFLFGEFELVALVETAIVQLQERFAIESTGVLIGGERIRGRATENGVTCVGRI